jgi:hypothetical protein
MSIICICIFLDRYLSRAFRMHESLLDNRSISILALGRTDLSRRRIPRRNIRTVSADHSNWKVLEIRKDCPTHCSTVLSLYQTETHSGHAQQGREIRWSLWSIKLVSLRWRSYIVSALMQGPEMSNCSRPKSFLPASNKLKQPLLSLY